MPRPATRNTAVIAEASSICTSRYGKEGLKITCSQLPGDQHAVLDDVAGGRLHPRVEREDPERGQHGARGNDHSRGKVDAPGHPVHAEEHHAEKRRFEKEGGQDLIGEQRPATLPTSFM